MIGSIICWLHERKHKPDYLCRWPELAVKTLVYYRHHPTDGCYIVFLDWANDIDWNRDDKSEKCTHDRNHDKNVSEILNMVSMLEPKVDNWPRDLKVAVKRILGEAIARAFRCEGEAAKIAISNAENLIKTKSQEVSRYWTLKACGFSGLIAAISAIMILIWRNEVEDIIGKTVCLLLIAACCGGIGALLSVISRLGALKFDTSAERRLHYAEGHARIVAGGISGVLVAALVKIGIILPVFIESNSFALAMCTAAMLGGASERFVPAIIAKVENDKSI